MADLATFEVDEPIESDSDLIEGDGSTGIHCLGGFSDVLNSRFAA